MVRGWFIGDFEPTLFRTRDVEIAVKNYLLGDREQAHYHKVSTEFTVVLKGKMKFNNTVVGEGQIVKVLPGEVISFECLESGTTVVVKLPGTVDDKYVV